MILFLEDPGLPLPARLAYNRDLANASPLLDLPGFSDLAGLFLVTSW